MVRIRLARHGSKKRPFYRIVAADKEFSRDGRFLEILGTYDPRAGTSQVLLKYDRVTHWIEKGAQPSETVAQLIKKYDQSSDTQSVAKPAETPQVKEAPAEDKKVEEKEVKAAAPEQSPTEATGSEEKVE